MRKLLLFISICLTINSAHAQKRWTEADRQFTLDNLKRTREVLVQTTRNLTPAQWSFRESPERWNIGEVIEHLGYWEMIYASDIRHTLWTGPRPDLLKQATPDSTHTGFIMETNPHKAPVFSQPMGLLKGADNLTFFLKLRDEHIQYVTTTSHDLRLLFQEWGNGEVADVHQLYIVMWGHVDRHMRQINKIKAHPNYPK